MGPLPLLASLSPPTQGWSLHRFLYFTSAELSLAPCVSPGPALLSLRPGVGASPPAVPRPPSALPGGSYPVCVPFKL